MKNDPNPPLAIFDHQLATHGVPWAILTNLISGERDLTIRQQLTLISDRYISLHDLYRAGDQTVIAGLLQQQMCNPAFWSENEDDFLEKLTPLRTLQEGVLMDLTDDYLIVRAGLLFLRLNMVQMNFRIDPAAQEGYLAWLRGHIEEECR